MNKLNKLRVMADLCLVPIGVGTSLSPYVARCEQVLRKTPDITTKLHSYGTTIEGDWDTVLSAVKECHTAIHEMGAPRIHTNLKLGTRNDKIQTMEDKIKSVEDKYSNL